MNYFELYSLKPAFAVDLTQLALTYQQLQQLTHPDKFATASEQEKLLAVQKNAQVNDAYQVLKSPLSRAEYLLELQGVELQHEQQTMQDTGFLMQQMEWREQLAEVHLGTDPLAELEALDDELQKEVSTHLQRVEQLLSSAQESELHQAADEVRKLKFLYKLLDEIELLEDKLDDF